MTTAIESFAQAAAASMAEFIGIEARAHSLKITTHCMYPSGGLVALTATPSGTRVVVSDDGGAVNEAQSAGIRLEFSDRKLQRIASQFGANFDEGGIYINATLEDMPGAIVVAANASRAVAEWLYSHGLKRPMRDFRALLHDLLESKFETIVHHDVDLDGARKQHKFANLISLPWGKRIIVDPVFRDPASMSGRIVAHIDVRDRGYADLEQRLIYDDEDKWDGGSLELLAMGAIAVPFSRSGEVLSRLSAAA